MQMLAQVESREGARLRASDPGVDRDPDMDPQMRDVHSAAYDSRHAKLTTPNANPSTCDPADATRDKA
eukprot:651930-Prymnesium_polylepis.1